MLFFGQLDAAKKWTKQLHLGALRNNNSRMVSLLGPDTGYDSMGTWSQAESLSRCYLDRLDKENALPQTILYNVNPVDNYTFATMIGNFQGGGIPGKMQFGSGWWFVDQKEGIEMAGQRAVERRPFSACRHADRFAVIHVLLRHEYFRRVVCNMLGKDIESGEIPDNGLAERMIADICFANARRYFNLPGLEEATSQAA